MSDSIVKPDPDPDYAQLVDDCAKHGLRVGLKSTVYKSKDEVRSAITYVMVNIVLRDEREMVTQVAIGPGGLPAAAKKLRDYLSKKQFIP